MISFVYIITNTVNEKQYVGFSSDPRGRFVDHCKKQRNPKTKRVSLINAAIQKYGKSAFRFEVYPIAFNSRESAGLFERYLIERFNSLSPNGYNIARGGHGIDPETARELCLKRVQEGTHPFQRPITPERRKQLSQDAVRINKERIQRGDHPWVGERGSRISTIRNVERVKNGTNPWCGPNNNRTCIANGTNRFGNNDWQREQGKKSAKKRWANTTAEERRSRNRCVTLNWVKWRFRKGKPPKRGDSEIVTWLLYCGDL